MKISKGTWLVVLGAVLVVLDQVIKVLVKTNMELGETINVIGGWFQLHFVLNEGMAFGMAFGGVWGKALLSVFRIVLFAALWWWISKLASRRGTPTGVLVGLTLIAAGALGNIVDRLRFDYVVDFISFVLIHYPIFNVADCYIVVSAILLFLLFMFVYKEADLEFLSFRKKGQAE